MTKPSIAANVASPSTIIPRSNTSDLLPGALLVAEPPHAADERGVLVSTRVRGAEATRKEQRTRPVATELAAHQKTVGQLVFGGHGRFMQDLVDATEETFVVQPLVTDAERRSVG